MENNQIVFKEDTHEYFLGDKKLISVTQLLHKHDLAPNYEGVSQEILERKAKIGTLIHNEIEMYFTKGEIGFTKELFNLIDWIEKNDYSVKACEVTVHNSFVAGRLDLLLINNKTNKLCIADVKKNSSLDKSYVMWQTNIYRHLSLFEKVDELKCFHFDNDANLTVVDLPIIENDVIELMRCELNGLKYQGLQLVGLDKEIARIEDLEAYIVSIKDEQKRVDKELEDLKLVLLKAMEDRGIKSVKTSKLNITYKAGYYKGGIDTKKFKEDTEKYAQYLELAKDYQTKTKVEPTLLITKVKEKKEKKNE